MGTGTNRSLREVLGRTGVKMQEIDARIYTIKAMRDHTWKEAGVRERKGGIS